MESRTTAWLPLPLACAAFAWLAGTLVLAGLAPMRGTATTTFVGMAALLLVPGFLFATALGLHTAWHSAWSGVATSFALGAGVTLPLAWLVRAIGWPLESGAQALVALELAPLCVVAYQARRQRLGSFEGLHGRSALEWCADGFVALAAGALALTFSVWIEPAMPDGDLWYYLSYIDWMAQHPGLDYVPHTSDPEEWNPRLQSSGFLAFHAMLARLVHVDANALQVFWSWLPLTLIPLSLVMTYALAVTLGAGALVRTALVVAQLALVYATLPYLFDRSSSGLRWAATMLLVRTPSQDKVFLAALLAPAAAMFAAEWLSRGQRRWLVALFATGAACVLTHPLGLPFMAMVSLPYALACVATRNTSWRRAGALALLLIPLIGWPLSQRSNEGAPSSLADDAGFQRRAHLVVDSLVIESRRDNRFTAHPSLIAHPLMIAGIASGLALIGLARTRADARYAFATTAAPLLMLYTPGIAPLAGLVVTPYLLWRFTWLLPIALSLAVATVAVATLARRVEPRAGPAAAAVFALILAFATSLPSDLARSGEFLQNLPRAPVSAASASRWIEPLRERVRGETVVLDPNLNSLAISISTGIQTGFWRWGSNPALFGRLRDLFSSPLVAPRHLDLLRALDAKWIGVHRGTPIAEALGRRSDLFGPAEAIEGLQLFRIRSLTQASAPEDPVAFWRERAAADPESVEALSALAVALIQQGNSAEARRVVRASLELDEANAAAHERLGTLLLVEREYARAIAHLGRSIQLEPVRPKALNNLAWVLATCPDERLRDPEAAVRHATILLGSQPSDPGTLDTVATAHAANGDFPAAIRHARRALLLYQGIDAPANWMQPTRERLALYLAGRPFIDVAD